MEPPEHCEGCGFSWARYQPATVAAALREQAGLLGAELRVGEAQLDRRLAEDAWSAREYAGHLRDVLVSVRERVVLASIVEHPTGQPIYRAQRVALGLYADEPADELAGAIVVAAAALARTIEALGAPAGTRTMVYSSQSPFTCDLGWVAQQGLHELIHHRGDIAIALAG